jgi:hypothetical protein
MATERVTDVQSTGETRTHFVDFTDDLPSGVTVASAAAVHTPPSGAAATPTVGTITGATVPVTSGPLAVIGRHVLTVTATLSDGETSVVRLIIPVEWEVARAGMADLIGDLRGLTDAGSNDYTVAGRPYWTDAQLQRVLDRYGQDVYRAPLVPMQTYAGAGTVEYRHYYAGEENLEGGAVFYIQDAAGGNVGTAQYSMNYHTGHATFGADTGGSALYWSGRAYDLNRAAADVWRQKAAHYATAVDFQTDNHRVSRGVLQEHCLKMAGHYAAQSTTATMADVYRGDMC